MTKKSKKINLNKLTKHQECTLLTKASIDFDIGSLNFAWKGTILHDLVRRLEDIWTLAHNFLIKTKK